MKDGRRENTHCQGPLHWCQDARWEPGPPELVLHSLSHWFLVIHVIATHPSPPPLPLVPKYIEHMVPLPRLRVPGGTKPWLCLANGVQDAGMSLKGEGWGGKATEEGEDPEQRTVRGPPSWRAASQSSFGLSCTVHQPARSRPSDHFSTGTGKQLAS